MPPVRFCSFLNPACLKICSASDDRLPLLQCSTISSGRVKLVQALFDRAKRDQFGAGDMADGVLIRLPHVNQGERLAAVHLGFQRGCRNGFACCQRRAFVAAPHPAELIVVNQMGHGGMVAANGAVRVFADFELPERHFQRVEHQEAPNERLTFARESI